MQCICVILYKHCFRPSDIFDWKIQSQNANLNAIYMIYCYLSKLLQGKEFDILIWFIFKNVINKNTEYEFLILIKKEMMKVFFQN